jgi:hypothetical protein
MILRIDFYQKLNDSIMCYQNSAKRNIHPTVDYTLKMSKNSRENRTLVANFTVSSGGDSDATKALSIDVRKSIYGGCYC